MNRANFEAFLPKREVCLCGLSRQSGLDPFLGKGLASDVGPPAGLETTMPARRESNGSYVWDSRTRPHWMLKKFVQQGRSE